MTECGDRFCSLREEACNDRFEYLEKNLLLQITANEKAVATAKNEMERRLEGMNEFRAQLQTQAATFLERNHYDLEHRLHQKEIDALREWKSKVEVTESDRIAYQRDVDKLKRWKSNREGATSWNNITSGAAVIISFITLIIYLFSKYN